MLARARSGGVLLALVPAALTVYLAFHGGGFLAGGHAAVAIVLLLLLAGRVLLVARPAEGFSAVLAVAAAALALFSLWTLLSGRWSQAPHRALIEFDRALLYVLFLVAFGSIRRETWRLRWMVRGIALAAVIVCCAGLATRLLPDVFPLAFQTIGDRLSYPVRYWNALGLLAALGTIMCFGLTTDVRESPVVRVLAAAAIAPLACALLLTLSRGAIAAAVLGLMIFAVVGHPRALLAGLAATLPATVIALMSTYDADLFVSSARLTATAQEQGHHLAVVLGLCTAGAGIVRGLLLVADRAVARLHPTVRLRRIVLGAGAAIVLATALAAVVAADVSRQYDRFVGADVPVRSDRPFDPRARLTDATNVGRLEHWRVALDDFERQPIHGRGAGTFELSWDERRPNPGIVKDAHSLYVEVLGELGLVGLGLLLTAIVAILVGVARRARGPDRALYATILAALTTWAVAAGIDWHWEMPVVSVGFFALGGAAIACARDRPPAARPPAFAPRAAAASALCVLMVLVPVRLVVSQDQLKAALLTPATPGCERVRTFADRSIDAVASRPQPYELKAACELQAGRADNAIGLLTEAVRREPGLWRPRYGLAVARARSGRNPRPAARAALARNPLDPVARAAVEQFSRAVGPRAWRRASRPMRLQVPPL